MPERGSGTIVALNSGAANAPMDGYMQAVIQASVTCSPFSGR
jgi:hypothetical protein